MQTHNLSGINKISEKLLALIPRLEQGEVARFQMLNGSENPDEIARKQYPLIYGKQQIPTNERIKDLDGRYVDIGVVESWDNTGKPERFKRYVSGEKYGGLHFDGLVVLNGGNLEDEELYTHMMISNHNENSLLGENRNKSIIPMYKLVDAKRDSKVSMNKFDTLKEAIALADGISMEDGNLVLASVNKEEITDEIVLKAAIAEWARNKPDEFIKAYNSSDKTSKASIKKAMVQGLITHNGITGEVKLGSQSITTIKLENNGTLVDALASFLKSATNGAEVLANIESQLGGPTKKAKKEKAVA